MNPNSLQEALMDRKSIASIVVGCIVAIAVVLFVIGALKERAEETPAT
jgi:hypothetical protein